jgi:hypothetical protein
MHTRLVACAQEAWAKQRHMILRDAITLFLIPAFSAEVKRKLRRDSEEAVMLQAAEVIPWPSRPRFD